MSDDARRLARRIVDEIEARAATTRSEAAGSRPIPQGAAPAAPEPDTPAQQAARRIVAEVFDHWRPDASEDGPPPPPERSVERVATTGRTPPDADPRAAEPLSPPELDESTAPAERAWEPEDLFPVDDPVLDDPVDSGPADSPAGEVTSVVAEPEPGLDGVEPEPHLDGVEPEPDLDGSGPEADVADVEPVMELPRVGPAGDLPDVDPAGDLPDADPAGDLPAVEPAGDVPDMGPVGDVAEVEPGTDEAEPAEVAAVLDADRGDDDTSAAVGPTADDPDRNASAGTDPVTQTYPRVETDPVTEADPRVETDPVTEADPRVGSGPLASEESEPATASRTADGSPMPTPSDEPSIDASSPSSLAARIVAEVFETRPVPAGATAVVDPARSAASSAQVRPRGEDLPEGGGSDTETPADVAGSGGSADHTQELPAEGDEEVDLLEVVDLTDDLAAVAPRGDDAGGSSPSRRDDDPPTRGRAAGTLDEEPTTSGRNGQRAERTETLAVRDRTDLAGSEAADAVSDAPEDAVEVGEWDDGPSEGDSSDQGHAAAQTEVPDAEAPDAEGSTGAEQLGDEELLLDVEPEPRRTGRWLLMTVLGAVGLALLFPLAVSALRELVAAGGG